MPSEFHKTIKTMIEYIEQEACEKVVELQTWSEEDSNAEKERLLNKAAEKIEEYYGKKEKQILKDEQVYAVELRNKAKMKILAHRQELIKEVIEKCRVELANITKNNTKYKELLVKLILQGMYLVMEDEIIIQCREKDMYIIKDLIPDIEDEFEDKTECSVTIHIDKLKLPLSCTGGVNVCALQNLLKVQNTFDSRLDLICEQLMPEIRVALFGASGSRKREH